MTQRICKECFDLFDEKVWHCPVCDHHWPVSCGLCGNCNEGERPVGGHTTREATEEEVAIVFATLDRARKWRFMRERKHAAHHE